MLTVWAQHTDKAAIVLDTTDFGVVQSFVKDNVIIVVTSGGSRNQVFVVRFKGGNPELLLRQVTKGDALICTHAGGVTLKITGIFAGGAPPRSRTVEVETDFNELMPKAN